MLIGTLCQIRWFDMVLKRLRKYNGFKNRVFKSDNINIKFLMNSLLYSTSNLINYCSTGMLFYIKDL